MDGHGNVLPTSLHHQRVAKWLAVLSQDEAASVNERVAAQAILLIGEEEEVGGGEVVGRRGRGRPDECAGARHAEQQPLVRLEDFHRQFVRLEDGGSIFFAKGDCKT